MAKKDDVQSELEDLLSDDDDSDDEEVTADDIKKMKKAELIAFIEEEGLDIDEPKTTKVGDLREEVIEAFFGDEDENEKGDDEEDGDEDDDEEDEDEDDDEEDEDEDDDEEDEDEDDDEEDEDEDDDEEDEDEDGDDTLTHEMVMEMDSGDLDQVVENEDIKVSKKNKRGIKNYRNAVVKALELEPSDDDEEEEGEEEEPKKSSTKQTVFSVASENVKKGKAKIYKNIPFKENSKRYHAAIVMMQESRAAEEHQKAATKSHRKAGISGNKEYDNTIDANLMRVFATTGGVFSIDDEDDAVRLLGFTTNHGVAKKEPSSNDKNGKGSKKGGKKNKK